MFAALTAAPAATADALPIAVAIAFAVTVSVAIGMFLRDLKRRSQLTALTGSVTLATALALISGALLVGGALGQSTTDDTTGAKAAAHMPIEARLQGLQLPTLPLD